MAVKTKFLMKFIKRIYKLRKLLLMILVIVVGVAIFIYYNSFKLNKIGGEKIRQLRNYYNIAWPNGYIGAVKFNENFFVGQLEYSKYRIVDDKVIYDGNSKVGYQYIRLFNGMYGENDNLLFYPSSDNDEGFEGVRYYNNVARRVMKFYVPYIEYGNYLNDLYELKNVADDKLIEMSISFDKDYSVEEAQRLIDEDIRLGWLWVDTFSSEKIEKMRSHEVDVYTNGSTDNNDKYLSKNIVLNEDGVYGIKILDREGKKIQEPEKKFIDSISNGRVYDKEYANIYNEIFTNLSKNGETIKEADIRIIGMVVSGKVSDMKQLIGQKYIKGATFGAIDDKY